MKSEHRIVLRSHRRREFKFLTYCCTNSRGSRLSVVIVGVVLWKQKQRLPKSVSAITCG